MKKLLALLLACVLLLSLAPGAFAQETDTTSLEVFSAYLNEETNTIAVKLVNGQYYELIDAKGTVLVPGDQEYTEMVPEGRFFAVEKASAGELPYKGLITGEGALVVPPKYHDVEVISDRWQAGILLAPSDESDWNYCFYHDDDERSYYIIDSTDFYFDGEPVGTLTRDLCAGSPEAYGTYLYTFGKSGESTYFNSKLERSPYTGSCSTEFDWEYEGDQTVYFHPGSGQKVFQPDCSLDPADLQSPYLVRDGILYDIKGQELAKYPHVYDNVGPFSNGYAFAELDGMYGIVNLKGEEVLPPIYDAVGNYEKDLFRFGYTSVQKDGMLGFVDAKGAIALECTLPVDDVYCYTTFAEIEGEDGITVVSAEVGELPDRYDWASFPSTEGCMAFVAWTDNDTCGIVDIKGNILIPFSSDYFSLHVSVDGSVALVETKEGYTIYRF